MEKMSVNIATVFSGIGAPEHALKKMGVNYNIVFACDNGEITLNDDIDVVKSMIQDFPYGKKNEYIKKLYYKTKKHNFVKDSYFANYRIKEDNWYDDIRFLDGKPYHGKVDIFVGGSPCQSFSLNGKRAGLEDTRGTLFYDFARLVKEIEPKVFIFENVPGMLNHDKGNTWKIISSVFESLNYKLYWKILNAKDYGIPQDRKRLFVVGFRSDKVNFNFPKEVPLTREVSDFLEKKVDSRFYLQEKGFKFVTNPKNSSRARIHSSILHTEKANQQFNWNGDFVFESFNKVCGNTDVMNRAYVSEFNGEKGVVRQLTHRECLRLMGFEDDFKIVVPNVHAYRQAGNSIVVNVLESIYKEIFKVVNFDE